MPTGRETELGELGGVVGVVGVDWTELDSAKIDAGQEDNGAGSCGSSFFFFLGCGVDDVICRLQTAAEKDLGDYETCRFVAVDCDCRLW